MKKIITLLAFLLITISLQAQFTTLWERKTPTTDPSWFQTGSAVRGLGYGFVDGNHRLYVAYDGNKIKILNAETGADVGDLTMTGVSAGTRLINDVKVSDDGIVFACNMHIDVTNPAHPFKVYRWDDESSAPTAVISYNSVALMRLGDKFTVVGSASDNSLVIYASNGSSPYEVVKFTTSDNGASFTATIISLSAVSGGAQPSIAPLATGNSAFYWKRAGSGIAKYSSTGIQEGTISTPIADGHSTIRFLKTINSNDYLLVSRRETSAPNSGYSSIVIVPGGDPSGNNISTFGSTPVIGTNSTAGYGDVDFKDNLDGSYTVYVLSSNNGLGAYTTNTYPLNSNLTPRTVVMTSGVNNSDAFSANGLLGTDAASFYAHWDATYLYLGWSGGRTNYSSDMFYAAIDTDPNGTNGASASIEGVGFQTGDALPDFYVVYENNSSFYGAPVSNGSAFEIYSNNANSWNFVSRTDGDDGSTSQIDFQDANNGQARLRIPWATLNFTPGASAPLGIVMWTNNTSGDYLWGKVPSLNPASGSTPKTLTHQFVFSSTGDGINPSTAGSVTALPVELTSFTALPQGEFVNLTWETATEVNNYGFEIERSVVSDQRSANWENIGFVEGHGNSNSVKQYSFTDNTVIAGQAYSYRLKQIDFDGQFEYSSIVNVEAGIPTEFNLEQNYPNPFNPTTSISFSLPKAAQVNLSVYNVLGEKVAQLINTQMEAGKHTINFNASNLSTGTYIYRIETPEFSTSKKMMLVK